jgi:exopolysaccharide biosynthesis polyprenyl glycosylphosphotransferase
MKTSAAREQILLIVVDICTVNLAWLIFYLFKVRSGWGTYSGQPDLWMPMLVICGFWLVVCFFYGLYHPWYAHSRFDEFTTVFKAATFGVLILFFAVFIDDGGAGSTMHSRLLIAIYWMLVIGCIGGGRMLLHTFHRRLLEAGIGSHNAVIVGWNDQARELYDSLCEYPALGYRVVGFLSTEGEEASYKNVSVLGTYHNMTEILEQKDVKDIIIAVDSKDHDKILDIVGRCNSHDVSIKIVPDLYDIISGQARTNQIYGFPLIEIMPDLMRPWERAVKRGIDICVSSAILVLGLPIWVLVALAIKIESRGPVFYMQERMGKDGKLFRIIKFRSMNADAEKDSGPVWADREDPRITKVGTILRRLRLDEFPQLINVLEGDMSIVGPRPERAYFVEQLSKEIPLYARRLKVRPGITGWAQVKHKYDENIDDVKKKVQYDLFYIENMSIRMDLKILLSTVFVILSGKGH